MFDPQPFAVSLPALVHAPETGRRPSVIPAPPLWSALDGSYRCRFAASPVDVDQALRLRFAVFNLELGEGLAESWQTGRDEDPFDRWCDHLIVESRTTGEVVGTYRLQSARHAAQGAGWYSAGEFALGTVPADILAESIEVGRACIAADHRRRGVLYLLWRGLVAYAEHHRARFFFGCCSLPTMDPRVGIAARAALARRGVLHPSLDAPPNEGFQCDLGRTGESRCEEWGGEEALPELFEMYLRFGGRVCSQPALDRRFGTVDFLVQVDVEALSPRARRMFLQP